VKPPFTPPTKARVLGVLEDLVSNFLYYDRKEDENLPVGAIEKMIASGELTIDEIVNAFRLYLSAREVGTTGDEVVIEKARTLDEFLASQADK
jgi:hypothetical protein